MYVGPDTTTPCGVNRVTGPANGLPTERLARADGERIVDELIATDMTLPVDGAGFVAWAYEEGLSP